MQKWLYDNDILTQPAHGTLVLHIYSCFLQEEQIFKSSKRGRPRDIPGTK